MFLIGCNNEEIFSIVEDWYYIVCRNKKRESVDFYEYLRSIMSLYDTQALKVVLCNRVQSTIIDFKHKNLHKISNKQVGNSIDSLILLKKLGFDFGGTQDKEGSTLLHNACNKSNWFVCKWILENTNCDVNAITLNGNNVLEWLFNTADSKPLEMENFVNEKMVAQLLIEHGVRQRNSEWVKLGDRAFYAKIVHS